MRRIRKRMAIIVVLITASLAGMLWVQIILLRKAFDLNRQSFRQNVSAALNSIVEKLEDRETVSKTFNVMVNTMAKSQSVFVRQHIEADTNSVTVADSVLSFHRKMASSPEVDFKNGKLVFVLNSPQRVRLRILDTLGQEIKQVLDETRPAGEHVIELDSAQPSARGFAYNLHLGADSATYNVMLLTAEKGNAIAQSFSSDRKRKIVSQVLDELTWVKRVPIESRINLAFMDSTIHSTLSANGIDMPYVYGIDAHDDSVRFATPGHYRDELRHSPFRAQLFPSDPFPLRNELVLHFPQQDLYLLKRSGGLFFSVVALMSVIVFCFVYTARTVFKQKHFADSLTQFINNMTHEFKTPISTIALAGEALKNPLVAQDQNKIQRYRAVIQDETQRMRTQVEKILQMAVLEEGDYELNISRIDVHELLADVAENFTLQIEKRNGEIIRQFNATQTIIEVDAVHFANVIHNLLDNANKYTRATPRLVVSTASDENGVHIRIEDNGIGLRPEEQKHVFDKYYRVPTGNVHDVKGFGLGLSYVKLMAEAHGGAVSVQSEHQKGSVFHVFMPYTYRNLKNSITH